MLIEALSSTIPKQVQEEIEKSEVKKEEFGNVLGSMRKPKSRRYRKGFTERLLPPA